MRSSKGTSLSSRVDDRDRIVYFVVSDMGILSITHRNLEPFDLVTTLIHRNICTPAITASAPIDASHCCKLIVPC